MLDYKGGLAKYHRDEAWRRGVVNHFGYNLRRMVRKCRDAGVKLVLVHPVSNLRDCPPFKAQHRDGLTPAELERWEALCREAGPLLGTDPHRAVELLRRAREIDDQHAGLHFFLGRCLEATGRRGLAREAYLRAKELDVCPLRMLEPMHDAVFDVAPNASLVHDVVVALMNARRQGNASTKTRRQVRGGGAKPFRQKGTGRSRQGSTREPQMRGGGVVFGPHKRSYRQKVPVRMKRKALCCVLSDRVRSDQFCVLDALPCEAPRTKPFAAMVGRFSPEGKRTLFVTAGADRNVCLSARNVPRVTVQTAANLNVLDVLGAYRVIVLQDALAQLEERLT